MSYIILLIDDATFFAQQFQSINNKIQIHTRIQYDSFLKHKVRPSPNILKKCISGRIFFFHYKIAAYRYMFKNKIAFQVLDMTVVIKWLSLIIMDFFVCIVVCAYVQCICKYKQSFSERLRSLWQRILSTTLTIAKNSVYTRGATYDALSSTLRCIRLSFFVYCIYMRQFNTK